MKKRVLLTAKRDVPILLFLWKWKVMTTAALAKRFYPDAKPATAYRRLWCLAQAGYIQIRANAQGERFVWMLTKKGFNVIKDQLPELKEEGFLSENVSHDFMVTAAHLGDWLCGAPANVEFFTEQQLRRYHQEHYPAWISKKELHRPDGYWRIKSGQQSTTIALEVELVQKTATSYRDCSIFYSHFSNVHRVLWIVTSSSIARMVTREMGHSGAPDQSFHNFILLKEFQQNGWQAQVFSGNEKGRTISSLLSTGPTDGPQTSVTFLLLDARKSYQKSKVCASSTAA